MTFKSILILVVFIPSISISQNFPPQVGYPGTTSIHKDNERFVGWAVSCSVLRGYICIADTNKTYMGSNKASYGNDSFALGKAVGTLDVVSLGDGGIATLSFNPPITNGEGYDFAVFENAIISEEDASLAFLELGFVEVSSDGENFYRFPATSNEQTLTQIGSFDFQNCSNFNNLAGIYPAEYGTPFDLEELSFYKDELNLNKITHIRIIDVIGSVNEEYASYDQFGNIINNPYPTAFNSCGFDLDAVGVLNQVAHDFNNIQVYPNPSTGQFNLVFYNIENTKITISNATGQQIINNKLSLNNSYFDLSDYEKGVYIIKIYTNDKVYLKKIILI